MGWVLPTVVNPTNTICVQLQVPDDPAYVSAFWGAILDLSVGYNWANDAAHTAKAAAARMRQMYASAQLLNCTPTPPPTPGGGYILRTPTLFRQNPANLCQLQAQCPDGSWDTIFDASLCNPNPAPGGGILPPNGGVCQDYKMTFEANVFTPLPFHVNPGDTIQINSLKGAGTDGTLDWYCPDGEYFIAGACAGGEHFVSTDLLPTSPHMSILLKIGSTYYPFVSGTFTVPSGVSNLVPYIGVNDATLGDNGGTYSLDINYCNNAAPPVTSWCRTQDLTSSPSGYSMVSQLDANSQPYPASSWVSGAGFEAPFGMPPPATTNEFAIWLQLDLGAATPLTELRYQGLLGACSGGGNFVQIAVSNDPTFATATGVYSASNVTPGAAFDAHATGLSVTARYVRFLVQSTSHPTFTQPGVTVQTARLAGTGANPFGTSNC